MRWISVCCSLPSVFSRSRSVCRICSTPDYIPSRPFPTQGIADQDIDQCFPDVHDTGRDESHLARITGFRTSRVRFPTRLCQRRRLVKWSLNLEKSLWLTDCLSGFIRRREKLEQAFGLRVPVSLTEKQTTVHRRKPDVVALS